MDIRSLYSHLTADAQRHRELRRIESAATAIARWPLLKEARPTVDGLRKPDRDETPMSLQ